MEGAAKIMDAAAVSPQIGQFIELAVNYTQSFMGATDAALGAVEPDNSSAILALQRASAVPLETVRQNLYASIEELGRIYMDFMRANYGVRTVEVALPGGDSVGVPVDFRSLEQLPLGLRLDVGASAYWSEVASVRTLDNLLTAGKIDLADYLERVPDEYISGRAELLEKYKEGMRSYGVDRI